MLNKRTARFKAAFLAATPAGEVTRRLPPSRSSAASFRRCFRHDTISSSPAAAID